MSDSGTQPVPGAPAAEPDMAKPADSTTNGATPTLETQLADAKADAAKNLDGWQRASAEFVNYRKRVDRERTETYALATVDAFKKILPIVDDLDRAVAFVPADRQNDQAIDGFRQIHRKFLNMLDSIGVKVINPVGEQFDPAFHEAIGQDDGTGKAAGTVTVVLQKGYSYGDRMLRPAMVRIAG